VEGSSNNKALEIFNGTDHAVDLADYQLLRCSNGDTTTDDAFDPCLEFDFFSQDSFDGLGTHYTDCYSVSNGHLKWDAVKAQYR